MGRFRWYVTTTEDETETLKAAITLSVQRELGTVGVGPPSPHLVPGVGGKRLYLDGGGGWNRYRHHAHGFPSKEAAETHAFGMTTRQPNLVGKLAVENLWYEPPEISLTGAMGVAPAVAGISAYVTQEELESEMLGNPLPILRPPPFLRPPCKPGATLGGIGVDIESLKKELGLGPKRPHDPLLDDPEMDEKAML